MKPEPNQRERKGLATDQNELKVWLGQKSGADLFHLQSEKF